MTSATLPASMNIPRAAAGVLVRQLNLPLGSLGSPLVSVPADPEYEAAIAQWWNTLLPEQRIPREVLATLAAPALVADIRVMLHGSSLFRTWALAGGLAVDSPWVLIGHRETEDEYEVQPIPNRQTLVNTLFAYLEAGVPVWEAEMRVKLPGAEFALLLALADLYSRAKFASLITHSVAPATYTPENVQQAYLNATQYPDVRYLFPFASALLPEPAGNLSPADVQAATGRLVAKGLLKGDDGGVTWTEPGLFLAESLHRRVCALFIDVAGANTNGAVGTQCSLFVRSDQPLWYFDIDRAGAGDAVLAGVSSTTARSLLDEILRPLGAPPSQDDVEARKAAAVAPPWPAYPPPPAAYPASTPATAPGATAFCGNCGSQLPPGARFCMTCGAGTLLD
jgi:hypothetical protein